MSACGIAAGCDEIEGAPAADAARALAARVGSVRTCPIGIADICVVTPRGSVPAVEGAASTRAADAAGIEAVPGTGDAATREFAAEAGTEFAAAAGTGFVAAAGKGFAAAAGKGFAAATGPLRAP